MRPISLTVLLLGTLTSAGATVASAQKPAASGKGVGAGRSMGSWEPAWDIPW